MTKTYEIKRKYKYVAGLFEEYNDAELLGINEEDGTGWIKYDKGTKQTVTKLDFLYKIKTPEELYEEEKRDFIEGFEVLGLDSGFYQYIQEEGVTVNSLLMDTVGFIFDKIKSGELVIKLDM